jgi:hypothetical protein
LFGYLPPKSSHPLFRFNKTTAMLFVTDMLTSLALTVALGTPVMWALLKIIKSV